LKLSVILGFFENKWTRLLWSEIEYQKDEEILTIRLE